MVVQNGNEDITLRGTCLTDIMREQREGKRDGKIHEDFDRGGGKEPSKFRKMSVTSGHAYPRRARIGSSKFSAGGPESRSPVTLGKFSQPLLHPSLQSFNLSIFNLSIINLAIFGEDDSMLNTFILGTFTLNTCFQSFGFLCQAVNHQSHLHGHCQQGNELAPLLLLVDVFAKN
jgi:hypothetical protein